MRAIRRWTWRSGILLGVLFLAAMILSTSAGKITTAWQDELKRLESRLSSDRGPNALEVIDAGARRVLEDAPLEPGAIRLLGLVAEARGDEAGAEKLMQLAERRLHADVRVQAWLFQRYSKTDRMELAVERLDAMLRVEPDLTTPLTPEIGALATTPAGEPVLATKLAGDPPWRAHLLAELTTRVLNPISLFPLFWTLATGPNPLRATEINPYIWRLVQQQVYPRAYLLWTRWLSPDRFGELGSLYNGSFNHVPSGAPFDWVLQPIVGAGIDVVATGSSAQEAALHVQFFDTRVSFKNVTQLLLLTPGSYVLRGRVKADGLRTSGKLRWAVACATPSGTALGTGEPVHDTNWTDFEIDVTVPVQGCGAQWLTLQLATRVASEQQIAGQVWFSALSLKPVSQPGTSESVEMVIPAKR